MKLIPTQDYSIRVATPPSPELTPVSEIMFNGAPTGKFVAGAVLEATLRWGDYTLIFLTDDIPFEDTLRVYFLSQDLTVMDSVRMGSMYSTGIFSDLDLTQADSVGFHFFGGVAWTLTLLSTEEFVIPIISEPKGVSRPFKFSRRIRIGGKPMVESPQEMNKHIVHTANPDQSMPVNE